MLVFEEAVLAVVESGERKGKLVANLLTMSHFHVSVERRSQSQLHVGSLLVHRIFRVDSDEAALGILAVERALRTAQHIDAVELIRVGVERALADERHPVLINAHGRAVHARPDASHVHRRGVARTVVRHRKRRHKLRHIAQVAQRQQLHFLRRKHRRTQRLHTQSETLFRLRNHHHLVQVAHACGVALFRNHVCHHGQHQSLHQAGHYHLLHKAFFLNRRQRYGFSFVPAILINMDYSTMAA